MPWQSGPGPVAPPCAWHFLATCWPLTLTSPLGLSSLFCEVEMTAVTLGGAWGLDDRENVPTVTLWDEERLLGLGVDLGTWEAPGSVQLPGLSLFLHRVSGTQEHREEGAAQEGPAGEHGLSPPCLWRAFAAPAPQSGFWPLEPAQTLWRGPRQEGAQ